MRQTNTQTPTEPCSPPTEWDWSSDPDALRAIRDAETALARLAEREKYNLGKLGKGLR